MSVYLATFSASALGRLSLRREPLMPDRHDPEERSLYRTGLEEALRRALDAEKGSGEAVEPMPEEETENESS